MFKLNPATLTYKHYGVERNTAKSLLVDQVMQIKTDSLNNLWIGTFSAGISYFNQKENTFIHFCKCVGRFGNLLPVYHKIYSHRQKGAEFGWPLN